MISDIIILYTRLHVFSMAILDHVRQEAAIATHSELVRIKISKYSSACDPCTVN